jgi:hypothetical protein
MSLDNWLKPYNDLDTPRTTREIDPDGVDTEKAKQLAPLAEELAE